MSIKHIKYFLIYLTVFLLQTPTKGQCHLGKEITKNDLEEDGVGGNIEKVAYSKKHQILITSGITIGRSIWWDMKTKSIIDLKDYWVGMYEGAMSPDESLYAQAITGADAEGIVFYSLPDAKPVHIINNPSGEVFHTVCFSHDQKHIIAATDNGNVYYFDAETLTEAYHLKIKPKEPIWSLKESPDGELLFIGTDSSFLVYDIERKRTAYEIDWPERVSNFELDQQNNTLYVHEGSVLYAYTLSDGAFLRKHENQNYITALKLVNGTDAILIGDMSDRVTCLRTNDFSLVDVFEDVSGKTMSDASLKYEMPVSPVKSPGKLRVRNIYDSTQTVSYDYESSIRKVLFSKYDNTVSTLDNGNNILVRREKKQKPVIINNSRYTFEDFDFITDFDYENKNKIKFYAECASGCWDIKNDMVTSGGSSSGICVSLFTELVYLYPSYISKLYLVDSDDKSTLVFISKPSKKQDSETFFLLRSRNLKIRNLTLSADNKFAGVFVGADSLAIFDLPQAKLIEKLKLPHGGTAIEFSETLNEVFVGLVNGQIKSFTIGDKNISEGKTFSIHHDEVVGIKHNQNKKGAYNISCTKNEIIFWSPETGDVIQKIKEDEFYINSMDVSQDGKILTWGGGGLTNKMMNPESNILSKKSTSEYSDIILFIDIIESNKLIVGTEYGVIKIFEGFDFSHCP